MAHDDYVIPYDDAQTIEVGRELEKLITHPSWQVFKKEILNRFSEKADKELDGIEDQKSFDLLKLARLLERRKTARQILTRVNDAITRKNRIEFELLEKKGESSES